MVIKDAINRYKLMQGYRVIMQPGFDCYGTVIEDLAIGTQGASLPKLDSLTGDHINKTGAERTLEMREQCRQLVKDSILSQMEDLSKWAIMTDFRYSYFTSSK
jgi:isoleucyl-tRNA synthetase